MPNPLRKVMMRTDEKVCKLVSSIAPEDMVTMETRIASLLPLQSAKKLITIQPTNDPKEDTEEKIMLLEYSLKTKSNSVMTFLKKKLLG